MPWVKIDDKFPETPKVIEAGPFGMALQVAGLCYCNRNLTDGFIPYDAAHRLLSWDFPGKKDEYGQRVYTCGWCCGMVAEDIDSEFVIGLLLRSGMWEQVDGGYTIHDYLDYQPSKEEVLAERERKREAGRLGGLAKAAGAKR
jgi:hypothetical protein